MDKITAQEYFNQILQLVNDSTELEHTANLKCNPILFTKVFDEFFTSFREDAASICYQFCVTPQSKIATCVDLMTNLVKSKSLILQVKTYTLSRIVSDSNWFRVQEAAINNLLSLKAYDILEDIKSKTTDDRIKKLIEVKFKKAKAVSTILSFLKDKFF